MEKRTGSNNGNDVVLADKEMNGERLSEDEKVFLLVYRSKSREVQKIVEEILGLDRE